MEGPHAGGIGPVNENGADSKRKSGGDGGDGYGCGIDWNEFHMPTEFRR